MTARKTDVSWPTIVGSVPPFHSDPRRACKNMKTDLFTDQVIGSAGEEAAKAVCERCPLRDMCRQFAVDNPWTAGVWGGTNCDERAVLRGPVKVDLDPDLPDSRDDWHAACAAARERRAEVAALNAKRVPATAIALRLGVSVNTIYSDLVRIRKAATVAKYPTAEERIAAKCRGEDVVLSPREMAEAIDRVDDGGSLREVAARLGIGYASVFRRRQARRQTSVA